MFLFNKVVFTFFQTKELNEVVLGNWFRAGVGGGRPFPSRLLVHDDVGVCHILSVFEHTYTITAITPELGYNQLIRHKKSNCQMGFTTAVAVANPLCSKTLVSKKSETPSLVCYIYRNPFLFLGGWYGQESILTDV